MLCEKTWAMLAKTYTCKTIASAAVNSAVLSLLPGQLIDLCRPFPGPEQLDYIDGEEAIANISFLQT